MGETVRNDADAVRLQASNFGPVVEADIALRPLTLFVGSNNSGKSHLSTLLYALQRLPDLRRFQRGFQTRRVSRASRGAGSGSAWEELLAWVRVSALSAARQKAINSSGVTLDAGRVGA